MIQQPEEPVEAPVLEEGAAQEEFADAPQQEEAYAEEPVHEEAPRPASPPRPITRTPGRSPIRAGTSGARAAGLASSARRVAPRASATGGGFFADLFGGIFHGIVARLIIIGVIAVVLILGGAALKLSGWRSSDDRGTEVIARKMIRELPDYSAKSTYYNKLIDVAHAPAYDAATTGGKLTEAQRARKYLGVLFLEMSKKARADKESTIAENMSKLSADFTD